MTIQTILVVEPSPIERAQLSSILTTAGYTVTVAGDGEEAVEIARRERPDLILMEVVMPGLNGYQATRALTRSEDESLARIPVILISAKGQDTDKVWGFAKAQLIIWLNP